MVVKAHLTPRRLFLDHYILMKAGRQLYPRLVVLFMMDVITADDLKVARILHVQKSIVLPTISQRVLITSKKQNLKQELNRKLSNLRDRMFLPRPILRLLIVERYVTNLLVVQA